MLFQALCALVRTVSKLNPVPFSACQLAFALASLTKEMPTFACTTRLAVVLKVRNTVFGPAWTGGVAAHGGAEKVAEREGGGAAAAREGAPGAAALDPPVAATEHRPGPGPVCVAAKPVR